MTKEQPVTAPQAEPKREVEHIREIIFGSQMREYHHQFDAFERDLERLQQQIDQLTEQLADQGSEHAKKTRDLRREMRQANDDIRTELRQTAQTLTFEKVDRMALGELFMQLGTQLKTGGSLADLLKDLTQ